MKFPGNIHSVTHRDGYKLEQFFNLNCKEDVTDNTKMFNCFVIDIFPAWDSEFKDWVVRPYGLAHQLVKQPSRNFHNDNLYLFQVYSELLTWHKSSMQHLPPKSWIKSVLERTNSDEIWLYEDYYNALHLRALMFLNFARSRDQHKVLFTFTFKF